MLTQPAVTSVFDNILGSAKEVSSNDSDFYTRLTQTLPSQFGDLPNYMPILMDVKLASLFDSEYLRNNDGIHLDRGISDNKIW